MRSILPTDVPPYFWTTTPIRWLLFLRLFDAHAHRLTLDRGQCRNGLQRLADTALTRLVGHHHHRHRRPLGMPRRFLQHRFNANGMLTEDAGNRREHPRLVHHLKAEIILTDDIIHLLEGDLLEAMRLIRLRRHAATAIFQNIARHIHDIPYHCTTGREGTGPATNEHIAS